MAGQKSTQTTQIEQPNPNLLVWVVFKFNWVGWGLWIKIQFNSTQSVELKILISIMKKNLNRHNGGDKRRILNIQII